MSFGKSVNSFSGFLDTLVTSGITVFNNYDMTDTTSYFYLLNDYSTTTPDT
jgi:hypothetical protein